MATMTTTRITAALAAAGLWLLAGLGAAHAAGPLDNPGFAKIITCSACHGQNGNSKSDMMPIIAGLDAAYFKRQIENYAAGKRPSPEMEPYAKQIQFLGLDQIAAFFAAQKREPTLIRVSPDAVAKGRVAAAPCAICHGENGMGDAARLIPALAGQPPGYLAQQMLLFKQDTRDPDEPLLAAKKALMRIVPDSQFTELAAYYSSLR
jgi:cytochrome c553